MDLKSRNISPVEIWGGTEYTIARVNDSIHDQFVLSGHRQNDLNLFSDLRINTVRYPMLWENYANNETRFFKFHDNQLKKLSHLGIEPIAGLLHHGSGPFNTNLDDRNFPFLLAEFALKIAERYPWIKYYTPVNEPLTTARFSGLYGIWYPHKKDDFSFSRMLLNELKGIILSMNAIKSINPEAGLIQTEDICKTRSTKELSYQADFENHRRWLTYDLLLGLVDSDHPLWHNLLKVGIQQADLEFFINNRIQPSVCGFNYYVTSERYLDHRKWLYPTSFHGGNGFEEYADVEAVRANIPQNINLEELLNEAWNRYHLPIALTEVHISCTREEQLRWLNEAYKTAVKLKSEGVDFRAITAWSFFGSFDWNSLLRQKNKYYESGVYDIRSGIPRPTALAGMIRSLNEGKEYCSSLLKVPGWWRRDDRNIFKDENDQVLTKTASENYTNVQPLLIIGATGSLGRAFAKICDSRGIIYHISKRSSLDISSEISVKQMLDTKKPWAVINAAGFTGIDEAEKSVKTCFRENTLGPGILADACKLFGIKFVTFSTDQVFDGKKKKPYIETDYTGPLNLYGISKMQAEEKVLKINPEALIIRSSFFFNPWHKEDSLYKILQSGRTSDKHYYLASDIIMSPSYTPDIVNTVLDLLIDRESGIWHLSNQEEISQFDFARMALRMAGLDETIISPVPSSVLRYPAIRPTYSVLKSSAGIVLPILKKTLQYFIDEFDKEPSYQIVNQHSF